VLRAHALEPTAAVHVFAPAGAVRLVGWDRDSIVVRGRVAPGEQFFFGGSARGVKLGIEERVDGRDARPCTLVVYVPRGTRLSVKTASASITGTDVSGWFGAVSGAVRLTGTATSIEAETMDGRLDLDVIVPWVRARTGDGALSLRGAAADADASTVAGTLDVDVPGVRRGRFASVTGDVRLRGAPVRDAILELSNHAGAIDLLLPGGAAGVFDLSTVAGAIENRYTPVQPVADRAGRGRTLHLELGGGGGHVTARTFRGPFRLRPARP
jgi:hypothetical protein